MNILKTIFKVLLGIILLSILYIGGMIAYASLTDFDPPPTETVAIAGEGKAAAPDTLSLVNWNIGYCGLGEESDFFYDGGTSVRAPKPTVEKNLAGILEQLNQQKASTDFFLLQEVDRHSGRSYKINQVEQISEELGGFSQAYGTNYKVGFIPIPLTNPMGTVHSGVSTWSRYQPTEATRYSFKGNYDWPTYLFFLDRCFLLERFPLEAGGELVLINTHNSAYDDGTLKQAQMEQLKAVLLEEYAKGNFVIVGGDWNQYASGYVGIAGVPGPNLDSLGSRFFVPNDYPEAEWEWAADVSIPTNRSLKAPFDPTTTYQGVIDFYLVSPNVEVLSVKGIDLEFAYSDHQPVQLQIALKRPESAESEEIE